MLSRCCAIVIRRYIYRDTSLLLTLFSREWGKLRVIIKGIRDEKNYGRYDGLIELFAEYQLIFYRRGREYDFVREFDLLASYPQIFKELKTFSFISYAVELLDYIAQIYDPNPAIYQLLKFTLQNITYNAEFYLYLFILRLLKYSGFMPHIESCVICKKTINNCGLFSVKRGGLICRQCSNTSCLEATPISQGTIATIHYLENAKFDEIKRLRLTTVIKKEMRFIIPSFLEYHIAPEIKSSKIAFQFLQ